MNINPNDFILDEIPTLHPLSLDYLTFWREQQKRCIEGHWLGGYYMPPSLYFYVNFGTILLNTKKSRNVKVTSRPNLRDLEWLIFRHWTEARGFSGFSNDEEFTGCLAAINPLFSDVYLKEEYPEVFNSKGERKEFRSPRTLLSMQHSYNKGRALYSNNAWNILMVGSRDTGKSYSVGAGIVPHSWLFNGATEYSEESVRKPMKINITVAAELAHYSSGMLSKTKFALDNLPGRQTVNQRKYPSPFAKQYRGSWNSGNEIVQEYKAKIDGGWDSLGSKSVISHRSFKDNPYAEQGTRILALILEECGMCSNLEQIYTNTKDNLRDGLNKTGTMFMLGTGGDMDSGTIDAAKMFYSPEAYDILTFEDQWEHRGNIGFFIPAYLSLNAYKDEQGFSKEAEAKAALLTERERLAKGRAGSEALNKEIQYRPIVPSEMFLSKKSNIFPVAELQRRLSDVLTNNVNQYLEKKVELYFDPESHLNGVSYKIDERLTAINQFPWKHDNIEGSVVIYEFPHTIDGTVPKDSYVIGCDPFRDNTRSGDSFAAIYVVKTTKYPTTVGHNEIVASYIGRPYQGVNAVNEILYKLSLFYGNAKIYFENAVGNVKDYFDKIKRLDLLARQPTTVLNRKASQDTIQNNIYGYPMSNEKIKWEALQYLRSWLLEDREQGKKNLDVIPDTFLLQQLIAFNMEGNFDSVMGLVGCIIGLEEVHNLSKRKLYQENELSEIDKQFISILRDNKNLFLRVNNEKFSEAEDNVLWKNG